MSDKVFNWLTDIVMIDAVIVMNIGIVIIILKLIGIM